MFLRSLARAVPRGQAPIRAAPIASLNAMQARFASDHAIANPTLASIEKRWEGMPPQEQAELWMSLRDRMKVDWHQMTLQEKKAGTYCLANTLDRVFSSIAINPATSEGGTSPPGFTPDIIRLFIYAYKMLQY